MVDDVQPSDPPTELLDVSRRVVPAWLRRITSDACRRGGADVDALGAELDALVERASHEVLRRLTELLGADVDEQRTTPLTLLRGAVREPTAWLEQHGVPAPGPAPDGPFPDDVYRLAPATWSDIDPAMHEPGLTWGAWKAMTVLARRRDDGFR